MSEEKIPISGGSMYHDAGFAGLPLSAHPQAGLLNKEQNVAPGRVDEVPNIIDDTTGLGSSRIAGSLFFK